MMWEDSIYIGACIPHVCASHQLEDPIGFDYIKRRHRVNIKQLSQSRYILQPPPLTPAIFTPTSNHSTSSPMTDHSTHPIQPRALTSALTSLQTQTQPTENGRPSPRTPTQRPRASSPSSSSHLSKSSTISTTSATSKSRATTDREFQYYGRHGNQWLFNDFSVTEAVAKGFRRVFGREERGGDWFEDRL